MPSGAVGWLRTLVAAAVDDVVVMALDQFLAALLVSLSQGILACVDLCIRDVARKRRNSSAVFIVMGVQYQQQAPFIRQDGLMFDGLGCNRGGRSFR